MSQQRVITRRALVARVNRALAKEDKQIKSSISRADIDRHGLDSYVIEDIHTGAFVRAIESDAQLVGYARDHSIMRPSETLEPSNRLDGRYKIQKTHTGDTKPRYVAYFGSKAIARTAGYAEAVKALRDHRAAMVAQLTGERV